MKIVFMLGMLALMLSGAGRTQVHMGTLVTVTVQEENMSDEIFALFAHLDAHLSTYKNDSEISQLNRDLELNVSEVTRKVLERSLEMSSLTDGAFDVSVGSVTHNAYRFGYENEQLPSKLQLQKAQQHIGVNRIYLEKNRVRMEEGTIIDLGGIGKGYAVDMAMERLQNKEISKAVLAASGDIGCLGECVIHIRNPFHPSGAIATIVSTLPRFAISTSGNYERYIKNKTHNHLIDPKTGKSQQRYASITLMDTGDNTRIDALSTAVAVMDEKKAMMMLDKLGIAYVFIHNDGKIIKSKMPHGISLAW